ncbi:MAG: valine--tRNA ligase [Candidatus Peregrinibacteria bacterium]|nr:valine--tRNA ligase [Candidatus Peregrinibacteria bacterium]
MLEKAYDPAGTEDRIYAMWESSGAFRADAKSEKESFTVSMPPPNATGQLHLGHAVMLALEDIFIRFNRMRGKEVLWVPGTDHAAIATENVVIKQIQKEEKIPNPRAKLGREELIRRIAEFVERSRDTIRSQVRKMGSSCDWSRERYTLEPALNRLVNEVFVSMYRDGLIYRGHRIVNWDPKLQTTVSDDEIVYEERKDPFYTFQYGPFQIGTSRPETKFGDKYVVMHPEDERYAKYKHGDTFTAEWINGPIKATIIKDKAVDPTFGTGVMTITPWHDTVDFELAERQDLDKEQIIGFDGKLLPIAGEFEGMRIEEARPKIVSKLEKKGLLVKIDEGYIHNVALSQRGKGLIEPQIKEQWFIDVNKRVVQWKRRELSLKEVMQEVVKTGLIKIIPERFEKEYFHWIDNLRDWCISRQIWWGHRVPVWYKKSESAVDTHVGVTPPEGNGWEQDPDTLDTWFSSALWTWSTLVDTKLTEDTSLSLQDLLLQSPDFMKFHPTDVLETGYDIIFFWVARMVLMTTYVTGSIAELEYGQVPFETVYLHGLIRTRDGRKMSKSDPDTMIDPLDMIGKYGADALRLSMIVGQSPGNDSRLYEEKIAGYRNFVNKLWNASRFVLMQCDQAKVDPHTIAPSDMKPKSLADHALLYELLSVRSDVTDAIATYRLSEAGERLYSFVWDFFCDWYLELSKGEVNIPFLVNALREILQLIHSYCPFVTEELWSHVKYNEFGMLIQHPWPLPISKGHGEEREAFQVLIDVVTTVRRMRSDYGVEQAKTIALILHSQKYEDVLASQKEHILRLTKADQWTLTAKPEKHQNAASTFLPGVEVHIPLEGLLDLAKEKASAEEERDRLKTYKKGIEGKLKNKAFVENAPTAVVDQEREKLASTEEKLKKIEERLKMLK